MELSNKLIMGMLYLDIGGTTINICEYVFNKEKYHIIDQKTLATPKRYELLTLLLKDLSSKYNLCSQILIGLPGPIRSSSKVVFCPPLNYKVILQDFQNIFNNRRCIVSNDLFPTALMAAKFIKKNSSDDFLNIMICSIGTSFGHAHAELNNENKIFINTYESAHKSLTAMTKKQFDESKLSNESFDYVKDLISYKSYFKLLSNNHEINQIKDDENIKTSKIHRKIIKLFLTEIKEIAKIHGQVKDVVLKGGLASYFKDSKLLTDIINDEFLTIFGTNVRLLVNPNIEEEFFSYEEINKLVYSNNFSIL